MRKTIIAFALAMLLCLSGCDSDIQITQEQNDLIAEYAAGVLLKYSNEYQYKYSKLDNRQPDKPENPTEAPSQGETAANNPGNEDSSQGAQEPTEAVAGALEALSKALGGDVRVGYNSYVVGDSYPVDGLVSMPATAGKKLLVLEFLLSNQGSEEVLCNGKDSKIILKIEINDKEYYQAGTIFNNDVANMKDYAIGAGKQDIGIAVFMIPESDAAAIDKIELTVIVDGQEKGSVVVK